MRPETKIIKYNSVITVYLRISNSEYEVMKLALKNYNNGYGLSLLRRLNKAE